MTQSLIQSGADAPKATATRDEPTHRMRPLLLGPVMATLCLAASQDALAVGETSRVSVGKQGSEANSDAAAPALSSQGRFVAFESSADNLVPGDTNEASDIFVHDRKSGHTARVSLASNGEQAKEASSFPAISGDGRMIAFVSMADNLVPNDTNDASDVFVHDRMTHQTVRVSVSSSGRQGNEASYAPSLSANGRFVAFTSHANNLVTRDSNQATDVFVHDLLTHTTRRVSVDSAGTQGNRHSSAGELSANGRWVAFLSYADNLAPGDLNNTGDVLVHDRWTGETTRVSVSSDGMQANGLSTDAALSADGRFVVFQSAANNLVPGDGNATFDIFVHDRQLHQTALISADPAGLVGNAYSFGGALSADGRFVAFSSWATNLDPDALQTGTDVFLHDRRTAKTVRVSAAPDGTPGDLPSRRAMLSADGRLIAFESFAGNLVAGDINEASDVFVRDRLLDRSATADLAVTQTVSPSPFPASSPITYTVTVSNHGPDAANDVTLVDGPLQATAVASQGTCSTGAPKVCYLGTVAAGAEATVTLSLRPRSAGTTRVWNSARVDAAPVDPNPGNNKTGLHVSVAP